MFRRLMDWSLDLLWRIKVQVWSCFTHSSILEWLTVVESSRPVGWETWDQPSWLREWNSFLSVSVFICKSQVVLQTSRVVAQFRGQELMGAWRYLASEWASWCMMGMLVQGPALVDCSAMIILKFSLTIEQGALHFLFALTPWHILGT